MYINNILADFAYNMAFDDLPDRVIERTKLSLIDYFSAIIAGNTWGQLSPIIKKYVSECEVKNESSVIGMEKRFPANMAALANATISHSAELDDGHRFGTSHPGSVIISTVLVAAEKNKSSGKEIIEAIVIGYEIMLRIATAINPSHMYRGFHTTGTCGALGSSVAAGKIYGLNQEQLRYAISIGALQSAGLQEMLHSNPMIKPLQAGKAAQSGIISAELTRLGAKGPETIFEGDMGFFKAMSDEIDIESITKNLGNQFEIEKTYFKFYPTCRHIHPVLDLAKKIVDKYWIDVEKIKKIQIETYNVAISETGKIYHPKTTDEAMFSIPYAVSVMIYNKSFNYYDLSKYIEDETINKLIEKVEIKGNKMLDDSYPERRGAYLTIILDNGEKYKEHESLPIGEPETTDPALIKEKFFTITSNIVGDDPTNKIVELIEDLEHNKSAIEDIMKYLRTMKARGK